MSHAILLLLCMMLTSLFPATGFGADRVLRVRDGAVIPFHQMIDDVKKADIVFVGEVHNMDEHHRYQLAVINALHEAETDMAVGLEMFRADSQNILDGWTRGSLSLDGFLPAYQDNWTLPWSLYQDIFLYVREHELPLVGLNVSNSVAAKVARQGFASLSAAEKEALPPGISCRVDDKYMELIRQAYAIHAHSGRTFLNFCEAQMVRDKSMAWHLLAYRNKNPKRTMVVLAGIGHAWKRGVAEQVNLEAKLSVRSILPYLPGQIDQKSVTTRDADYVLLP